MILEKNDVFEKKRANFFARFGKCINILRCQPFWDKE
jgi:hypothetical protein